MTTTTRCGYLFAAIGLVAAVLWASASHGTQPSAGPARVAAASLAQRPLGFVANHGQASAWASHLALGQRTAVLFGPAGLSFRRSHPSVDRAKDCDVARTVDACTAVETDRSAPPPDPLADMTAGFQAGDAQRGTVDALDLRFVGARPGLQAVAEMPSGAHFSRFHGPPSTWQRGLPLYDRLVYREVWSGIDIVWEAAPIRLKHSFVVQPGADPHTIQLAWQGARALQLASDGALTVSGAGELLRDEPPVAWQVGRNGRNLVEVAYDLDRPVADGAPAYGFALGAYDPTLPLIIDPAVVVSASFLGTADADRGLGVAVDPLGHIFLTGRWGDDGYVARLSPDGTHLDWMAMVGGDQEDGGFDVDVDASGAAVVTGTTHSTEKYNFPLSRGPDLTYNGGPSDGFVCKLTPDGTDMTWCGYFGGAGIDFGEAINIDNDGYVTVQGPSNSTERTLPVVVGPDLTQNGRFDAWIGRVRPEPFAADVRDNYLWAGFIGGAGDDTLNRFTNEGANWSSGHLAVDGSGSTYVSGETTSTEASFPDGDGFGSLPGPDQTYNGAGDAWVAKIRADGVRLLYAGYLGGAGYDNGKGMAVDARGAAWLTGQTNSDERSFPIVGGPGRVYAGNTDAFVARIRPDGTGLEQSGYVGGDDWEFGQAVALDPQGGLILVGATESNEDYFPVKVGPDLSHNGPNGQPDGAPESDIYVGRLRPGVTSANQRDHWDFLGYIGGAARESAYWVAIGPTGRIVIVGDTESNTDTFPDGGGMGGRPGLGEPNHGDRDAFVAIVDWSPEPSRAFLPWAGQGANRADAPTPAPDDRQPTPTTTRLPNNTPTPTDEPAVLRPTPIGGAPPGESCLYVDDFSDPRSGWPDRVSESHNWHYVDGQYEMRVAPSKISEVMGPDVAFQEGAYEATVTLVSGDMAWAGIRVGLPNSPIAFAIRSDRNYEFMKRVGDSFTALRGPEFSEYIHPVGQPNRLRLEVSGTTATLFVNGFPLDPLNPLNEPTLAEPGVAGFLMRTRAEGPAVARFDDVRVTCFTPDRATATAVATATPDGDTPLFEDDFSNLSSGWPTVVTENSAGRYIDGQFEITVKSPKTTNFRRAPEAHCTQCAIEVSVSFITDIPTEGGIGVEWGAGDTNRYYARITSDGEAAIDIDRTDDSVRNLIPSVRSPYIHVGTGTVYRLRLERRPGRLKLFVDGHIVLDEAVADLGNDGRMGLVAYSRDVGGTVTRFDDFIVLPLRSP